MLNKCLAVTLTLLFCLLMLESGLRLLGQATSTTEGFFEQWGDFYRLKKNISVSINWPSFSYHIYTNSFGFRDAHIGEPDITNRDYYIFLGGSDVFGNGVNYEDSFVGIVANYADKQGIEVLNLAVGGHGILSQESLLKDFLQKTPAKPSKIFICVNDFLISMFDPRRNSILVKDGYLLNKKTWLRAYIKVKIGENSTAYCYFRNQIRRLQIRLVNDFIAEEGLGMLRVYDKRIEMYNNDKKIHLFKKHFAEFEKFCASYGIQVVYVYLPLADSFRLDEVLLSYGERPENFDSHLSERLIVRCCSSRAVKLINLRPVLKESYENGEHLRFLNDAHYNEAANEIIGNFLVSEIFSVSQAAGK